MAAHPYASYIVTMFAITNPIGNLAIFIGLAGDRSMLEQRKLALTTAIACLVIMIAVTWFGDLILKLFGISIASFQIAGGIIITLLGLTMMRSKQSEMQHTPEEQKAAESQESIAVVPLAMPIIAGPGAITTILVNGHSFATFGGKIIMTVCNLAVAIIIYVALYFSGRISDWLGVSGIKIATRIMGLILVAMAMSMLVAGLIAAFPALSQ